MVSGPTSYGADAEPERQRDVPFAVGTVVTRRWYQVTREGQLESPFQMVVWPKASEPQQWFYATCIHANGYYREAVATHEPERFNSFPNYYGRSSRKRDHVVGSHDCDCGFYSYWRKPSCTIAVSPAGAQRYVGAVIENAGRITYGDKGMRSQKIRILAFVLDRYPKPSFFGLFRFLWTVEGLMTAALVSTIMSIAVFLLGLLASIWIDTQTVANWGSWLFAGLLPTTLIWIYLATAGSDWFASVSNDERRLKWLTENYPDVPVYDTWKEANKAFPATKRKDLP